MGFLTRFSNSNNTLLKLPSGSFTVDREGCVLVGTLPSSFPSELMNEIGREVIETFKSAESAQLPLSELVMNYPSLRITARDLRGGAIVFLSPRGPLALQNQS
jgi:hypothetical protein